MLALDTRRRGPQRSSTMMPCWTASSTAAVREQVPNLAMMLLPHLRRTRSARFVNVERLGHGVRHGEIRPAARIRAACRVKWRLTIRRLVRGTSHRE